MSSVSRKSSVWDRDPDAWYQEPSWPSDRLFQLEKFQGRVVDPCAGLGTIPNAARNAGLDAEGYDLRDRGFSRVTGNRDFFTHDWLHGTWPTDNIVSNPPYATWAQLGREKPSPDAMPRAEEEFLRLALIRARRKVAIYMLSGWLHSEARGRWIETLPLYREYRIGPRPSCPPGRVIQAGQKAGNGTGDYSWFVFLNGYVGAPTLHWLRREA
jgi:hypothetical protein